MRLFFLHIYVALVAQQLMPGTEHLHRSHLMEGLVAATSDGDLL